MEHGSARTLRRDVWILVAVVALALGVRFLYWQEAGRMSLVQIPTGDAATYVFLAEQFRIEGPAAPLGEPYRQAPLYPIFLWGLASLGLDLGGIRAVQFLLGAVGVGLLALVGRRLAGRSGMWVAGIGGALYGPFVFYESDLLSIAPAVFLIEVGLLLWGRRGLAAVTGLCFGLAALAQPNFLLAGLMAVLLSWIWPGVLGWDRRRAVALLTVGLLLPPAITLTRNLAVSGEPIVISANGGINFFVGNNPAADGTFHLPPDSGLLNRTEGLFLSAKEIAEEESGRALSSAAVDRHWWLKGVDYWIAEPGRALGLTFGKVVLSLNDAEIPSHYDYTYFRDEVGILRILPTFGLLLPLGGVGLILAWRRRRDPLVVLFGAFLVAIIPFFITGRYRLPLAVFLFPAAALAATELWAARRSPRTILPLAAGAVAYVFLAFFPLYSAGTTRAHMLNIEAGTLVQQGRLDEAERLFLEALTIAPNHPEALNNLAYVAELRGNEARALELYEQAIAADPGQAETYLNAEDLHRKSQRPADALLMLDRLERARGGRMEDVQATVAYRRGINTLTLGDTLEACAHLEDSARLDPRIPAVWMTLSTLYRRLDRPADALRSAEQGIALVPNSPEALVNLARSLEDSGRLEESLAPYRQAYERTRPNPDLAMHLAEVMIALGRAPEAESFLLAANQPKPRARALLELGRLYESQKRWTDAKATYRKLLRLRTEESAFARERLVALGVLAPNASR